MKATRKQLIEDLFDSFQSIKRKMVDDTSDLQVFQITLAQAMILRMIFQSQNIGVKEIAKRLHITSSAATQQVDTLVKKGFLLREVDEKDRRALRIHFTQKTKLQFEAIKEKLFGRLAQNLLVLDDDELREYLRLHQKIAGLTI